MFDCVFSLYRWITYTKFHYIDGANGVEGERHGLEPTEQEQRRVVSEVIIMSFNFLKFYKYCSFQMFVSSTNNGL